MQTCERCEKQTVVTTMSMFNTQMLCRDCLDKERRHPDYPKAKAAELNALRRGIRDFPGIGKPDDL